MRTRVEAILASSLARRLVTRLLNAYAEVKQEHYLGHHRAAELASGHFCEVALRCVQQLATGSFVSLSRKLDFDKEALALERVPTQNVDESARILIPRLLRAVMAIRNRRNVGHVSGDVDPNFADSTLAATSCDWVLAELIRLTFNCPIEEAQALVDGLVVRKVPVVQDFDGDLKVLRPRLSIPQKIMVLLYAKEPARAPIEQLTAWLGRVTRRSVTTALSRLEHDRAYVHAANGEYRLTELGLRHVEETGLLAPGEGVRKPRRGRSRRRK